MNLIVSLQRLLHSVLGRPEMRWLLLLLIAWFVVRVIARMLRQPEKSQRGRTELAFDLATLSASAGGSKSFPLRLYHLPARLGLVVVAPLGREGGVVDVEAIPRLLDEAVPGLSKVYRLCEPKTWVWPVQLSAKGFRHQLAGGLHVAGQPLPGSPWAIVVGRANDGDRQYMIALALWTNRPNKLDVIEVDSPYKWLDVIRLAPS
ncbi:MAG: hypothetical protein GXP27_22105 [Planctomycetes bacterium]|nr:hypothetical protein [Planctomycetota bacterium]